MVAEIINLLVGGERGLHDVPMDEEVVWLAQPYQDSRKSGSLGGGYARVGATRRRICGKKRICFLEYCVISNQSGAKTHDKDA